MGDKAKSEHSCSDGSTSSSDSSSGSSDGDEDTMEPVRILGHTLVLPQELCEDYGVFREFFSMRTWDALSDEHKDHLKTFLPKFSENQEEEREKTIKMLFNHEPFHFTSPLDDFFNNLRQGNYRPDIAKMRNFLMQARAKQQKHKIKAYYARLLPEVLISRERLLATATGLPPGPIPALPFLPPPPSSKNNYKPIYVRAKQRYFEELNAIRSEVGGEESDDDNYPEGPEEYIKKKKNSVAGQNADGNVSGTLGGRDSSNPTSLECLKNVLATHWTRRQYRETHPELNTSGITLDDIKQRVAMVNGAKKLMFGGQKSEMPVQKMKRGPKKDASQKQAKPPDTKGGKRKEEQHDSVENRPLLPNIKIKCEQEESDSESSSFVDPVASPRQTKRAYDQVEVKQEVMDPKYPMTNLNYNEPKLETEIKQEPQDPMMSLLNAARGIQPVPIKLEDLDGIDMMALPVEIADDSGEVVQVNTSNEMSEEAVVDPDEALTETTHANFLSLVRALFPARAAHRASKQQLHARCIAVMSSPIAPLNTWYNLSEDWCAELDSALSFLAGERGPHPDDFVPYLQFMPESQMYQWIGAGRDCDSLLGRLCERWLRSAEPPPPRTDPLPPRYPTSWTVRAPSSAELADFRAQERRRFTVSNKPFTYVMNGYRSVVGPCARGGGAAGGGAALLVDGAAPRPRHATFPALLRDALARLPNGEGTRHDVLTLIRMSQWLAPCSDRALLTAVSSTLDRFVSAKRDPVVKYDQRSAMWTYLHRHRSEEDWLKIVGSRGRGNRANFASRVLQQPPPQAIEMEVGSVEEVGDNGSDTDVDVDDSSAGCAPAALSSAQLLMQATQAAPRPPPRVKPKLVAVEARSRAPPALPPPKPPAPAPKPPTLAPPKTTVVAARAASAPTKQPPATPAKPIPPQAKSLSSLTPKQASLMTQAARQASLMAQSAKQASVIAHLTKQSAAKGGATQAKQVNVVKQTVQSPKQVAKSQTIVQPVKPSQPVKQAIPTPAPKPDPPKVTAVKSTPPVVSTPHKSPLIKQRPLQKQLEPPISVPSPSVLNQQVVQAPSSILPLATATSAPNPTKVMQGTRSLLIRAPTIQTTVTAAVSTPTAQATASQRRGIVRVLSPASPSGGKSLISPRALMQQGTTTTKKRSGPQESTSVTAVAQSTTNVTTVVSSVPTAVSSALPTRTVHLAGGRTVQLAANQTVHLPGGQTVQLSSGHTLQLSSLQLPTHSVRLPSGQTVQLASPQALRAVSTASVKNSSPRAQQSSSSPTAKAAQSSPVQIPISSVQLAGQTVQIAGQTVQLAGQSVQLTGHTVKLPSGQSVQVASQSVLPPHSVQLPSGQTVQLSSGGVQTVQLGQNVLSNQVAGGSVQLSGQTVQLSGQTVQLPSGQTLQLAGGQTVQLSSGQTIQLAGQTVQLTNQAKTAAQIRNQAGGDKIAQPIVAKLITNAQSQMVSLEGAGRALAGGVRVVGARAPRPLLLAAGKPLHTMILQQSDGSAIRVTTAGGPATSQTIVLSSMGGQTSTTSSSTTTPVLKLQQVNPIQQVKLPQGIKLQQALPVATATTSGVRSVVMDAQQLKLVGGRHVLARILRHPHPQPPQQ